MVNTLKYKNKELHQCGECGLKYEDKETAEKCQAWCKEHKSCNLDIIKNSVKDADNGDTEN